MLILLTKLLQRPISTDPTNDLLFKQRSVQMNFWSRLVSTQDQRYFVDYLWYKDTTDIMIMYADDEDRSFRPPDGADNPSGITYKIV